MKNIYSNIFSFNKKTLSKSILSLKRQNVVALPTETVYGLAGNAYSRKSVNKIYKLKKRPKFNPLIIHYFNSKAAENDVIFNKNFFKLYKKFCPGPITFVLKKRKKSKIKSSVAAGLNTVAIRFPSHRVVRAILKRVNFPLAMPSANLSMSISPVNALDVADEFKKNIKLIINGGKSKIGIESTVIDLTANPKILRPGIIGPEVINRVLKISITKKNVKIKSPGMLKKHYSPGIPMLLNQKTFNKKHAFITLGNKYKDEKNCFNLSKKSDLKEAASNLYKTFRKIKKQGFKKIYVTKIPNLGPGIAINDRLKRASN
ncbi:MAG: threonylcarbamoyl-AMP synthase [Candidatus Pelagibacter sp. TMED128]|nr:MAG: threonylcarbamoyl-AMP synthase [Candidatus Pelagibacter sp. TMED128]|tara:strand:- start:40 stop:987 length:948 start_codon:yes stop_codon:yes gene_type:complete